MTMNTWDREQVPQARGHHQNSSRPLLLSATGFPASLEVHIWVYYPPGLPPIQPQFSLVLSCSKQLFIQLFPYRKG